MLHTHCSCHIFIVLVLLFLPYKIFNCNYPSSLSIRELIAFESAAIANTNPIDYQELAEKYLSRAESYLISGEQDLALSDFQASYELASLCNQENDPFLLFHSLFGQAIVYGCNEMFSEFHRVVEALKEILDACPCKLDQELLSSSMLAYKQIGLSSSSRETIVCHNCNTASSSIRLVQSAAAPPIYGPDRVSIRECIEFAQGTTRKCRYLITLVPKPEMRVLLNIIIDDLENRAINCCKAGGLWKACLQPLVSKWYLWNEKWQVLGIPPDPAWD